MNRKKLIIVGAGGLGRIVHDVLSRDDEITQKFVLPGFLDTRVDMELPLGMDVAILGNPLTYQAQSDDVFIPAVGDPKWRKKLLTPIIKQGVSFFS